MMSRTRIAGCKDNTGVCGKDDVHGSGTIV